MHHERFAHLDNLQYINCHMIAFGVLEHAPNFDGREIVSDLVPRALTKSENERTQLWVESLGKKK